MDILAALRNLKHQLHVGWTRDRPVIQQRLVAAARTARASLMPYQYDAGRYQDPRGFFPLDFFLHREAPEGWVKHGATPANRLWCVWAGDNDLTPRRAASMRMLREMNPDVDVTLVTPSNLHEFIAKDHPIHKSYEHLSLNHRSDYLRAYLLHHYGGAYADIKPMNASVGPSIARLSDSIWALGYPEPDSDLVANLHGPVGDDIRLHHSRIIGIGVVVAKPRTPFTAEWLAEVERRMDYHASLLKRHPAVDPFGQTGNYPLTWIGLGALVFQPLELKYLQHIAQSVDLLPQLRDYR